MKKLMLLILCILIFVILFNGCEKTEDSNENEYLIINQYESIPINYYVISEDAIYDNISSWEEYILSQFNIEIKLNYINSIDSLNELKTLDGLFQINSHNTLVKMINANLIQEIDERKIDEKLTDTQINAYSMDNNLYAIPIYSDELIKYRFYFNDVLGHIKVDDINSTSTFYSYLVQVANNNKLENIKGAAIYLNNSKPFIDDIYKSFSIYINDEGKALAFNPNTNLIEDAILSDNAEECFNYINHILDTNVLHIIERYSINTPVNFLAKYQVGSFYIDDTQSLALTKISNETNEREMKVYSIGDDFVRGLPILSNNDKKKQIEISYRENSYVLLNQTKKTDNYYSFINEISNTKNLLVPSLMFGIIDDDFKMVINNPNIIIFTKRTGILLNAYKNSYAYVSQDYYDKNTDYIDNYKFDDKNMIHDTSMYNIYSVSLGVKSSINSSDINDVYEKLNFDNIITKQLHNNTVSVTDAIDEYKLSYYKLGIKELLIELNKDWVIKWFELQNDIGNYGDEIVFDLLNIKNDENNKLPSDYQKTRNHCKP